MQLKAVRRQKPSIQKAIDIAVNTDGRAGGVEIFWQLAAIDRITQGQTDAQVAIETSRAALLAQIKAPTLVFHGQDDPLLPYACGEDTARRIPGARLIGVPGMGHDLPVPVVERLLAALLPHLQRP